MFSRGTYVIEDAHGERLGEERFLLSARPDGGLALQAFTVLAQPRLCRHIQYIVTRTKAPRSAAIELSDASGQVSSAWFLFGERTLSGEIAGPREGRLSQRVVLENTAPAFGTHALINDGWFCRLHDLAGETRQVHRCAVSSVSETGETGLAAQLINVSTQYVDASQIVGAFGSFDVLTYLLGFESLPPLEVAVRADDHFLVRLCWEHTGVAVRLAELAEKRDPPL